jgi:flagellar hook-associated protein 2
MANEIGNTLLNSLTKSTFDVGNMAKVLAEADVAGPLSIVERKSEKYNTELNALTYLQQNLSAFNTYAKDLSSQDLFAQFSAASTDDSVVSATVTGSPAQGSFTIQGIDLAQAQVDVSTTTFGSPNDAINTGTLEINGQAVTVDGTNNTLQGLVDTINNQGLGVSASIINNNGQYQMMLSSDHTGVGGAFTVGGTLSGDFGFNNIVAAQDAKMKFNGVEITNSTNNFQDVVQGLSVNLKSTGSIQTVTVGQNTDGAVTAIKDFVEVYNQLQTILKDLGSYETLSAADLEDPEKEFTGDLAGNSILKNLQSQIRESMTGALAGISGDYNSLASIGIEFDRYGMLQLDEAKLNAVASTNMESLSQLFSQGGVSSSANVTGIGGNERTLEGVYSFQNVTEATRAQVAHGAFTLNGNNKIEVQDGAQFDISIDGSDAVTVTLNNTGAMVEYTAEELASIINSQVNNNPKVQEVAGRMSVTINGGAFEFSSNRWGAGSSIEITNSANLANTGIGDAALVNGTNVDGKLVWTDDQGVNHEFNFGGVYVDPNDGRKIKVSDFAVSNNGSTDMRGLEFQVNGAVADGETLEVMSGFGAKVYDTIQGVLEADTGLISQRVDSLNNRLGELEEKREKIDLRYEKMELKYRMQFSMMQSIMSQMQETQNFLTQTYNRPAQQ